MNNPVATGSARPRRVLLLGEDTRIVLPVVRSLGRGGVEVHLGWCPPGEPVLSSRHLAHVHDLPPFQPDPLTAALALGDLHRATPLDLILPVTEAATYALQQMRGLLPPELPVHLLGPRAFEVCFDKSKTHALAMELGIDVPRSRIVAAGTGEFDGVASWSFPVAVKPLCSVDSGDVRAKQYVRRADDWATLRQWAGAMAPGEQVLVQEWFVGEGLGVEFLAHEGRPLRLFQHRRLHETIGYGSTYRESVPVEPALADAVRRLLGALDYTGVGMAEFRRDPRDGRFVLLEINARFWGSLPLALAAGADFPMQLCEMLIDGGREFPQPYRAGVRCRDLVNDTRWTWRCLRGRTHGDMSGGAFDGWEMNQLPRTRCLRHLMRGLLLRDHIDTFAPDDPRPFLHEVGRLLRLGLGVTKKG